MYFLQIFSFICQYVKNSSKISFRTRKFIISIAISCNLCILCLIVENSYAELCKGTSPRYVLQQPRPDTNTFATTNNVSLQRDQSVISIIIYL